MIQRGMLFFVMVFDRSMNTNTGNGVIVEIMMSWLAGG
jgi:hypothetical protein